MTTYYVGSGGNDGNSGLTWALRKLTLNGAEDIPVAAADTVYVGPGTYRELLTVDVSGTAGNPITYIGDYGGSLTDGIGGVVRITGSDNDQTATRANCITATSMNYRTFTGFLMDTGTGPLINAVTASGNWIISDCIFFGTAGNTITFTGTGTTNTIQDCYVSAHPSQQCILFSHTSVVDNAAHLVQNCVLAGGNSGVYSVRVGGFTIKNTSFLQRLSQGVQVGTALTIGQTVTVNNCLFHGLGTALNATAVGEITEDYNNIFGCATARANTNTGANSLTYSTLFDARWFFELVGGKGRMLSPFDLASYCQLVNVAGTSPSTTDMRGTAVIGAQREWGALEYDPALLIRRVIARQL